MNVTRRIQIIFFTIITILLLLFGIVSGVRSGEDFKHIWIDEFTERYYLDTAYYHIPPSYAFDNSWIVRRGTDFEKISGNCWRTADRKRIVVRNMNCVFKITTENNYVIFIDGSLEGY